MTPWPSVRWSASPQSGRMPPAAMSLTWNETIRRPNFWIMRFDVVRAHARIGRGRVTRGAADGPADVDLRRHVARIGALHHDFPRALELAVTLGVGEARAELAVVVVEVGGTDAGLDRALAELVELRRGRERLRVAAETAGAARAALAEMILAEDLAGRDLTFPGALARGCRDDPGSGCRTCRRARAARACPAGCPAGCRCSGTDSPDSRRARRS